MASKKVLADWSIAVGPYPGLLFGIRDYNYDGISTEREGMVWTTKDRVLYIPLFMVVFTFIYASKPK